MLDIKLNKITKKFGYQTILKDIDLHLLSGEVVGLSGRNGSGKSTLLRIISSYLSPTSGEIVYSRDGIVLSKNRIPQYTTYSAPYIKVTQEMNLSEAFNFQQKFKPQISPISYKEFLEIIELKDPKLKEIRQFSSGMQQKINVALAIISKSDLLILDEPTSYLDQHAKQWFQGILRNYRKDRTILIASNDEFDFDLTEKIYHIEHRTIQNTGK